MKDKIIKLLQEEYNIANDIEDRVVQLLECIQDDNQFYTLDQIMLWFKDRLEKLQAEVTPINLKDCKDGWNYNKDTKNLEHASGGFFKIIGVRTDTNIRESGKGWTQPMVDQGTEASIVGLIKCKFNKIPHYLVDIKFEPGNYGKLQFSPTLQCTYDNLNKLHKGKKPLYHEYFVGSKKNINTLFEHWYPEDGGRFYLKRVKNMIIEIDNEIDVSPSHVWMTMFQLKQLLKQDNLINAHLRSILSYL